MRLMKKTLPALLLALALAVASFAQDKTSPTPSGDASAGPPKMVIDSFSHDFGEVVGGTPLRHAFKVKNVGKGVLKIESVVPG